MASGGKRAHAGRPRGEQYGEATIPLHVPVSKIHEVKSAIKRGFSYKPPLYGCSVRAGFPSPADDYIELHLDLNSHLIKHPSATFFLTASDDSMIQAGIALGDMLIVDRSLEAAHGAIVIAAIDGDRSVKRLFKQGGRVRLMPENVKYTPIECAEEDELIILGVVTFVIHEAH